MTKRSAAHSSFVIERLLAASPQRAFRAWSNPEAKRRWFVCHGDWAGLGYSLDFRVGGLETNRVQTPEGVVHAYNASFHDIVANERIIYAYSMHVGEAPISTSLATVEFAPHEGGTRITFTEQVVFLDGYSDRKGRILGTKIGLDRLQLELQDALKLQ